MFHRSAHLIANNIIFDGILPLNLSSGVTLRRPNEAELFTIRGLLQTISGNSHSYWIPYEALITQKEDINGFTFTHTDNPANWHYYLLSDDHGGTHVYALEQALLLLEPSIDLSIRVLSNLGDGSQAIKTSGHGGFMPHIFERYHYGAHEVGNRLVLTTADILLTENISGQIASLSTNYEFVKTAAQIWQEMRRISQSSRLQVIGFFSIIECLITHSPRLAESLDSISHQLCGKLRLITNRMGSNDLLTTTFGSATDGSATDTKVWKRLYSYRSSIAHGNTVSFKREFSVLKSHKVVVDFLSTFTRNLLLHALNEPQLFSDLKDC